MAAASAEQLDLVVAFLDGTLMQMSPSVTSTVLDLCRSLEQKLQHGRVVQQVLDGHRPLLPDLAAHELKDCGLGQCQLLTAVVCETQMQLRARRLRGEGCALVEVLSELRDCFRFDRDGNAYVFEEVQDFYQPRYPPYSIRSYWQGLRKYDMAIKDALAVGFTHEEFHQGGVAAGELRMAGLTPRQLLKAGFTAFVFERMAIKDALAVGFTHEELRQGGVAAGELRKAGLTPGQLFEAGFTALDVARAGYIGDVAGDVVDLVKDLGLRVIELKDAGFHPRQLRGRGFPDQDILAVGYTPFQLHKAGYGPAHLEEAGYSLFDVYCISTMKK